MEDRILCSWRGSTQEGIVGLKSQRDNIRQMENSHMEGTMHLHMAVSFLV
ncbi:MAG: hypothetical protein K2O34_14640 [Acetatifactor sp.]|nr:hypothetical protein [Acetatifactor sp.]